MAVGVTGLTDSSCILLGHCHVLDTNCVILLSSAHQFVMSDATLKMAVQTCALRFTASLHSLQQLLQGRGLPWVLSLKSDYALQERQLDHLGPYVLIIGTKVAPDCFTVE